MASRSTRVSRTLVAFAFLVFASLPLASGAAGWRHQGHAWVAFETPNTWSIEILSSAPDQVSGGDALVRVTFPGKKIKKNARVLLNGADVTSQLQPDGGDLVGVVTGFVVGANVLELRPSAGAQYAQARLDVTNYPKNGPIFSGPQQQPFVCTTARNGLGQPFIDNQDHFGIPVAQEDASGNYPRDGRGYPTAAATIIGWSKNCDGNTRFQYQYRNTSGAFLPLPGGPAGALPADIATTTTLDGQTVPYIVRWERGVINRFVYSVAMLAPTTETSPTDPDDSLWNGRLVFSLEGGVAIGRTQGTNGTGAMLRHDVLQKGYAIVTSTALRTNTHYNLELSGETALMLKEHFIEDHGVPLYTVGVGGSGGAIQQYAFAQNQPTLLDAAIPQYSYSDMITQTIHVGDCELIEHYFDKTDRFNAKWKDVLNRRAVQGLNASVTPVISAGEASGTWNPLYSLYTLLGLNRPTPIPASATTPPPLTECRRAWFGLTPLVLNPVFTNVQDIDKLAQGTAGVDWTHAGDLVNVYGTDASGFGRSPWDNVGVQYGLQALKDGVITSAEFLDLNAKVGSWKEPGAMVQEGFPFVGAPSAATFDPWSSRNMNLSPGGTTPAPRRHGNIDAGHAAYEHGIRFDGNLDIPVIDWRHYLEHQLDMHHSHQSFATRQRLQVAGTDDHQVIWFTDARPGAVQFDQTPEAFEVIDEWVANIRNNPAGGVAGNKPARAVDRCFDTFGNQIAAGDHVWDGVLDANAPGACTQVFPIYSSTRRVAGGPFQGGIFKCGLESVDDAIADGVYGSWTPDAAEHARLLEIFPEGVCDWSQPDQFRP
ncbi:MAG TPA: DUF6351 family protein [Myxococcota bacterium]|nr:DUF6351 family protein [Myxococcota bacterium]